MAVVAEEQFVVVAREGVHSLGGLRGRRVGLGAQGSGTRYTALRVLRQAGVPVRSLSESNAASMSARADLFCRGALDAVVFVLTRPNAILDRLLRYCGRVISVDTPAILAVVAQSNAYRFRDPVDLKSGGPALLVRSLLVNHRMDPGLSEDLLEAVIDPDPAFGLNRVPYRTFTIQEAGDLAPYPVDPGARRFFQRNGVGIP